MVDADGECSLLIYDGFEVRSKVQADLLADMAQFAKGRFLGARAEETVLDRLYRGTTADKPRRQIDSEESDVPAHRYHWFVLLVQLLLGFDQIWTGRRTKTS